MSTVEQQGDQGGTPLAPELVSFLEGGCSLIVGTVDATGEPHASRGWGVTVLSAGRQARVLLGANDAVALEAFADGGRVAITAADVPTLRSVQLKGHSLGLEVATAADCDRAAVYVDMFFADVETTDGTPRAILDRLVPGDYAAGLVAVAECFDQTPGPAAGRRLDEVTG